MPIPLNHMETVKKLSDTPKDGLIQLVCVSSMTLRSRLKSSVFDEVEAHARSYNQQHGITGTLCYGNGHFLQCLEGEKDEILTLQERIFADGRHKEVQILSLKNISQRSFEDWRMRLLFLERWLWSPATKKQADQLSPFLPFAPHGWTPDRTAQFINTIQTFDNPPHIKAAGITYNAMGNMFKHIAAPHQAFLIVQGFLAILLVIGLYLLTY